MNKYLKYQKKLKEEPPINNPYLDAILRVIMDLEDRIENDNTLMLGRIDVERLIEMYEFMGRKGMLIP